jgi:site-specific recombinase XerD
MAGELTDRVKETGLERVKEVAQRIAHDAPKLADLGAEQLEKLARIVVTETLKEDLRKAADLEKIPYQKERALFVQRASRSGSERTRKLYNAALDRLDDWCKRQGFATLQLAPAQADDWIESLKAEGRAPSTVNLEVAAASAFWTWMERRHTELRNPFRGTRARPAKKAARALQVPTDDEVRIIENAAQGWLKAAIVLMGQGGLRAGALPSLRISGQAWTATTKGKEQTGRVPMEARDAIQKAGLSLRSPFGDKNVWQIEDAFRYLTKKLHAEKKIEARYSCHDLRHAFAVRIYEATHDIYQVERALGHATVGVTETYLRSLGILNGAPGR